MLASEKKPCLRSAVRERQVGTIPQQDLPAGNHRMGLKSSILGQFYCELGWRWVPDDGGRTPFGHTHGHTDGDANVCLLGTRHAPLVVSEVLRLRRHEELLRGDCGIGLENIVFHIERGT